jgi:hypothetical protein
MPAGAPLRATKEPAAVRILLDTRPKSAYCRVSLVATADQAHARRPPLFSGNIALFADSKGTRTSITRTKGFS